MHSFLYWNVPKAITGEIQQAKLMMIFTATLLAHKATRRPSTQQVRKPVLLTDINAIPKRRAEGQPLASQLDSRRSELSPRGLSAEGRGRREDKPKRRGWRLWDPGPGYGPATALPPRRADPRARRPPRRGRARRRDAYKHAPPAASGDGDPTIPGGKTEAAHRPTSRPRAQEYASHREDRTLHAPLRSNGGPRTLLPHFRARPRAHLDALVAGAGGHPPPMEVERHIVDEILVVRRDAARHKHGCGRLLPPPRGRRGCARTAAHWDQGPGRAQRCFPRAACAPRAARRPTPGPSFPARPRPSPSYPRRSHPYPVTPCEGPPRPIIPASSAPIHPYPARPRPQPHIAREAPPQSVRLPSRPRPPAS